MVNYGNGKVYKIVGTDPNDKCYVGSTTKQYLCQRMTKHRGNYTRWKAGKPESRLTSFELFDKYGLDNCTIVLLENCAVTSKDELMAREQHYITTLECVNKINPVPDPERDKKYREANKDVIRVRGKNWREKNADIVKEKKQEYYEENKEMVLAKCKAYRDADPEKTKLKKKEERIRNADNYKALASIDIKCEVCDCNIRKYKQSRHNKTAKHLANLNKE